jgi:hypothetical protein
MDVTYFQSTATELLEPMKAMAHTSISASKSGVQKPSQMVAKRKIPRVQEISQLVNCRLFW